MTEQLLVTFATVELAAAAAPISVELGAGDTPTYLSGLAMPFGVASQPSANGRRYRFLGAPDNPGALLDVVRQHNTDDPIGQLAEPMAITDAGMNARARLYATTMARDVAVEASEGARAGFSMGVSITPDAAAAPAGPDGVYTIPAGAWSMDHLGVVRRPAFTAASGVTVHNSQGKDPDMGATITELDAPTVAELAAAVAELLHTDKPAHPLGAFSSLGAFAAEFYAADDSTQAKLAAAFTAAGQPAAFAVPDQTLADNPGLNVPTWRTNVARYLDNRQPVLSAFGRSSIDAMSIHWPYLDPALDLDAIIAEQGAEKADLSGVKVKVLDGNAGVKSAGAVSDVSYQLLKLSKPSYLAVFTEVMLAAWARWEEAKATAAALAAGVNAAMPALTTEAAVKAWLVEASADVEDACGAPANIVRVAPDVFQTIASLEWPQDKNTGSSDASTLRVNVSGLDIRRARFMPVGTGLVSHDSAAKFPSSGPSLATAEDVRKLGRDIAVWGMYGDKMEAAFPAAIRTYGTLA